MSNDRKEATQPVNFPLGRLYSLFFFFCPSLFNFPSATTAGDDAITVRMRGGGGSCYLKKKERRREREKIVGLNEPKTYK